MGNQEVYCVLCCCFFNFCVVSDFQNIHVCTNIALIIFLCMHVQFAHVCTCNKKP